MGSENQKDMEKLFSEKLDALIAGRGLEKDAEMSEDVSSALDFAQKMVAATPVLSSSFETRLRTQLLQKLAENETAEKSWLSRLFPQRPVWQAAAVLAMIVIAVGIFAIWRNSVQIQPGVTEPASPVVVSNIMKVEAGTDKNAYAPGEPVKIEVALENATSGPLIMEQFPPALSVMEAQSRQPVFTFEAGSESKTLLPGEVGTFVVSWNQRDQIGRRVTGDYYLELEDMYSGGQGIKLTFSRPVTFNIAAAAIKIGKIYQTINLNQTQTINGITVALQKLELADKGAKISAVISAPPDYNQQPRDYTAFAVYYLDKGWVNNAGLSSVEYGRADMKHTWLLTEPIPEGTEELLFVITSAGKWEGPWQFTIPLGR